MGFMGFKGFEGFKWAFKGFRARIGGSCGLKSSARRPDAPEEGAAVARSGGEAAPQTRFLLELSPNNGLGFRVRV